MENKNNEGSLLGFVFVTFIGCAAAAIGITAGKDAYEWTKGKVQSKIKGLGLDNDPNE